MTTASDYSSAKIDRQTYAEISLIAVSQGRTIKDLVTDIWEAYKASNPDVARTLAAVPPVPRKKRTAIKKSASK
jgi:hypothetical protein